MDGLLGRGAELDDAEQQQRLEDHCGSLRQGDLLHVGAFSVIGAPGSTLDDDTRAAAGFTDQPVTAIERDSASGLWAVVSQTCDIRAALKKEPTLAIAELIFVEKDQWEVARDGLRARARFAYPEIAGHPGYPVLDVRTIQQIEKAALGSGDVAPFDPGLSPLFRTTLATWLARRFGRHAFPDQLEDAVLCRLRETVARHGRDRSDPRGALIDVLEGAWVRYDDANCEVLFIIRQDRVSQNRALASGDAEEILKVGADGTMQPVVKRNESQGSPYRLQWKVATANTVPADQILYHYHPLDLANA